MHTTAPQDGQRAVRVRSSTDRSEEKSNELFAPHLQLMYFLRETIGITGKKNDGAVNNGYYRRNHIATAEKVAGNFFILQSRSLPNSSACQGRA